MAVYPGNGAGSIGITKYGRLGNGAGGALPLSRIMVGNGSDSIQVFPPKKVFRDNFDRSDQVLGQLWNWWTIGTSPYFIWCVGNNARMYDDNTDGQRLSWTSWMDDTSTDKHYSKGKIAIIGNSAQGTWVSCNGNQAGTDHVGFQWTGSTLQLFTRINDTTTARGTSATRAQAVGDWLEIRSVINPSTGIYTYNGYVNGSLLCSWTDSTSLAKKGAAYRRVGFGMQRNRSFFSSTLSSSFSEWEGGDL